MSISYLDVLRLNQRKLTHSLSQLLNFFAHSPESMPPSQSSSLHLKVNGQQAQSLNESMSISSK